MYGKIIWKGVVIHHSASSQQKTDRALINNWHKAKGWGRTYKSGVNYSVGYHFIIHTNGVIETGRPLDLPGAHTVGYNDTRIGICLCGNFEKDKVTWDQYKAAAELICWLQKIFKFPDKKIGLHRELTTTACPGKNFEKAALLKTLDLYR